MWVAIPISIIVKIFRLYLARYLGKKTAIGLPFASLLLYYIMSRLVGLRWSRAAKSIGELLQRFFSTNYAVNYCLANAYNQLWNPGDECKALMRIVMANNHDLDLLTRAGESAAYAADATSLERLRDIAAQENLALMSYLNGLLACLNGQANYQAHFKEAVKTFFSLEGVGLSDAPGKLVSILTKKYIESGLNLPEFFRRSYNIRELSSLDELLKVDDPSHLPPLLSNALDGTPDSGLGLQGVVVLISCSEGYLDVFADYYIRTFRHKNSNIIHFHVLAENVTAARDHLEALKKKYSNIRYSIEPLSGRSQTYITIARFLICRDLMNHYKSDMLISDIDLHIDFDLSLIGRELVSKAFDFGLCDAGYSLPWAKFAAGFSYFRVANHATDIFLELFSKHLMSLYSDGGFFSMDQTGMLLIYEYMQARGDNFRMLNLYRVIDFKRLISVPKQLQRAKIKCKYGNGGPQ